MFAHMRCSMEDRGVTLYRRRNSFRWSPIVAQNCQRRLRLGRLEEPLREPVAEAVRNARKAAGLSQEELAWAAGLDRTYISQIERQKRNVTILVLARIAKALKTTPDRLLILHRKTKK